jgi:phage terminase large subunit-like protein
MATDQYKNYPVVIGIDAAPKHDCTAAVAVTYDSRRNKLIHLTHRIWTPNQVEQMDFETTVESYVQELYNKLNVINISYDPAHLHQTMMRLAARGLPVTEFIQSVGNMVKASQGLYNLLKYQQIESYPDEEMESHIVNAIAKQEPNGFRLVKDKRNRTINKPMDAAIALAIASYVAVARLTVDTGEDVKIEAPFSDISGWKTVDMDQSKLPYMFRED